MAPEVGIGEAYWGEIDATVELVQRTRVRFLGGATRAELRCSQTGSHGPAEEVDLAEVQERWLRLPAGGVKQAMYVGP